MRQPARSTTRASERSKRTCSRLRAGVRSSSSRTGSRPCAARTESSPSIVDASSRTAPTKSSSARADDTRCCTGCRRGSMRPGDAAIPAPDAAVPLGGRRRYELEFLPAALEIVETPPSPVGRTIALTIAALFCIALAWASLGYVDITATASGKIVPTGRTKLVQPLEAGIVRAIHVRDGQTVKAG